MDRAKRHLSDLENTVIELQDAYQFVGEVQDQGWRHVYRVVNPPPIGPQLSAIAGDCIHNLRCSLDHLVFELIRLNGGEPSNNSGFPIRKSRCVWNRREEREEPTPLRIGGNIPREALETIEAVQPYNGGYEGELLAILNNLDNVDKHRQLWLTATTAELAYVTDHAGFGGQRANNVVFTRRAFADNEVVAIATYDPPKAQLDPNLKFLSRVSFRDGPRAGFPLTGSLNEIVGFLEEDLIPRFVGLFPPRQRVGFTSASRPFR
ncbi:MAG TPA: hypothetical protein VEH29_03560 [Acidimicrobiales bacterium]|nr:hypothetical protein [Acidimicrobiales bacterium]